MTAKKKRSAKKPAATSASKQRSANAKRDRSRKGANNQPPQDGQPRVSANGDTTESPAINTEQQDQQEHCLVVGIGASAGGLDAYKQFLQAMPANSGMAFVLIQHLDPTHESMMADLLSNYTQMPVEQVDDATPIQPNHVYMIPPSKFLKVHNGGLFLEDPVERRGMRMPIDYFFRSLAEVRKERAICIVLSGTGSDGTLGLKEVKATGGMTMVQSPDTADHDGMPRSAISTNAVDFVLPIEEIPDALIKYADHPYVNGKHEEAFIQSAPDAFNSIVSLLRAHTEYDFRCYKKGTLTRRIQRRMGLKHLDGLDDYLRLLRDDRNEVHALFKDLLISVTHFFREKEAFAVLEEEVLASIVREKEPNDPIRIWVPGCATGEESYSIAMLLVEQCEKQNKRLDVQLFATDVDDDAVAIARSGLYTENIAADITSGRLQRFFQQEGDKYRVNKRLREGTVFAVQNLIGDPPFSNLDLISCRNVMIYLENEIQKRMLQMFHFGLRDGGYLFLGGSETVGRSPSLFEPVSNVHRIYRKIASATPLRGSFPIQTVSSSSSKSTRDEDLNHDLQINPAEQAKKLLLERHAPATVMINRDYEIKYFQGPVRQFLDFPAGEPTNDLASMVIDGLRTKLRGVVHRVLSEKSPATAVAQRVRRGDDTVHVRIYAELLPSSRENEPLVLISFTDVPHGHSEGTPEASSEKTSVSAPIATDELPDGQVRDSELFQQMEYELRATREDLQSSIEELETSNEELKASSEEVMSMNEELQSTNEELETSREELQSLNEELSTVNGQLEEKVSELENTTNDLSNLLTSTEIGTIFLDTDFCIRQFTPATAELMHIIPGDVGRPISDLVRRFNDSDLLDDCRSVLNKLTPIETEIEDNQGKWFIRRVLPYRTGDNRIDGVVVTFTDVSRLKSVSQQLESREAQQAAVATLGRSALAGMRLKELMTQACRLVSETLGADCSKVLELTADRREFKLVAGVGWKPGLVGKATVHSGIDSQAGYTLQSRGPVIVKNLNTEKRFSGPDLLLDHGIVSGISTIIGPEEQPWGVLGTHTRHEVTFTVDDVNFVQAIAHVLSDAIRRRFDDQRVRRALAELEGLYQTAPVGLAFIDTELRYQKINEHLAEINGLSVEEHLGKTAAEVIPALAEGVLELQRQVLETGEPVVDREFRGPAPTDPDQESVWLINYFPVKSGDDIIGLNLVVQEITELAEAKASMEVSEARIRRMMATATVGIGISRETGEITEANDYLLELLNYPRERFDQEGMNWRSLLPLEHRTDGDDSIPELSTGERMTPQECEILTFTGKRVPVLLGCVRLSESDEAIFIVDHSQQKDAERQLRIINDQLEARVRERTDLIEMLHDVATKCHSAKTLKDATKYVLKRVAEYDGWLYGSAYHPNPEDPEQLLPLDTFYERNSGQFVKARQAMWDHPPRVGEDLPGQVYQQKKSIWFNDLNADLLSRRSTEIDLDEVKTAAAFPVMIDGQVALVLEFFCSHEIPKDSRIRDAMTSVTSHLARTIDRLTASQRLEQVERRFNELATNIDQVFWIRSAIGSQKIEYVSPGWTRIVGRPFNSLLNDVTQWNEFIHPDDRSWVADEFHKQAAQGSFDVIYRIIRADGEIRWVHDKATPVKNDQGEIVRYLGVCEDITERRRLQREVSDTATREQRRVSQDLHDSVGQELTGLTFITQSLAEVLHKEGSEHEPVAEQIAQTIREALGQIRRISHGLAPVDINAGGLMAALDQLAARSCVTDGTQCSYECETPIRFRNNETASNLFRIAQEAVANALKHADAQNIRIILEDVNGNIDLRIEDDGQGLPAPKEMSGGMGLDVMRYRCGLIGGNFSVQAGKNGGTCVSCQVPRESDDD